MKLLVLGASGKTGSKVVEKALAGGYDVTAFVRNKQSVKIVDPKLNVYVGDARNENDVTSAMKGQDAVITALGSLKSGDELISRSTKSLISAAQATGVKRIVMMSSYLVLPNYSPSFVGKMMNGIFKGMVSDKISGEALLKQSNLDWTIVYPTTLDGIPAGKTVRFISNDQKVSMSDRIAREDVATFMLDQLTDSTSFKKEFTITTK